MLGIEIKKLDSIINVLENLSRMNHVFRLIIPKIVNRIIGVHERVRVYIFSTTLQVLHCLNPTVFILILLYTSLSGKLTSFFFLFLLLFLGNCIYAHTHRKYPTNFLCHIFLGLVLNLKTHNLHIWHVDGIMNFVGKRHWYNGFSR